MHIASIRAWLLISLAAFTFQTGAQTSSEVMTPLWTLVPNSRFYLSDNDSGQRGLAYNPVTKNVLLVSRTPTNNIIVLDAATGAEKHFLNVDPSIIASGADIAAPLNSVGVSRNGRVYAANLVTAGNASSFRIYLWDNDSPNSVPQVVFSGNPNINNASNLRWGDTISLDESGDTLQILAAPATDAVVALFAPQRFSAQLTSSILTCLDVRTGDPVPGGFAQFGHAWLGNGIGFFAKSPGFDLRFIQTLDASSFEQALVTASYGESNDVMMAAGAIAVDSTNRLLAMLTFGNPDYVRVYDFGGWQPKLIDQAFFPVKNVNNELTGAAAFGDNQLFVLNSNNGIMAFSINPNALVHPYGFTQIDIQPGPSVVLTWQTTIGRGYQLQFTESLAPTNWIDVGSEMFASTNSISVTNAATTAMGFYRLKAR